MKYLFLLALFAFSAPAFAANECPSTPYRNLGKSCADLGLDTNRAVCRPGQRYALMCDDAVGGRVRTCQSPIRCDGSNRSFDPGLSEYRYDDRRHDGRRHDGRRPSGVRDYAWQDGRRNYGNDGRRPFGNDGRWPFGFGGQSHFGNDSRGQAYYQGAWRACETLRFDRRGEPVGFCSRGTLNRDCQGRCEGY
jgi:hypothetical protein